MGYLEFLIHIYPINTARVDFSSDLNMDPLNVYPNIILNLRLSVWLFVSETGNTLWVPAHASTGIECNVSESMEFVTDLVKEDCFFNGILQPVQWFRSQYCYAIYSLPVPVMPVSLPVESPVELTQWLTHWTWLALLLSPSILLFFSLACKSQFMVLCRSYEQNLHTNVWLIMK